MAVPQPQAQGLAAGLQANPRMIRNPLLYRRIDQLCGNDENDGDDGDVGRFYNRHHDLSSVVTLDVLKRGALVARNPNAFRAIGGITGPEVAALATEDDAGLMQLARGLKVTLMTTACAAIVQ
ncbi:hypothetical protein FGG08_006487 [Glutinoglossum americanum]|uniref:Uncharacterized protein n=1 Tax=Glutinoglossum americanum TaxID=1670608 RepID=A0A9P8I3D4_9PEZI|nr:hypothetical protein FGG08_006487 [Glutinoglossum americanum]